MGALTALLVMAALLSSSKENVPPTSGLIMIDVWFVWFIASVFLITIIHIFIEKAENRPMMWSRRVKRVNPKETTLSYQLQDKLRAMGKKELYNFLAQIVFLIKTIVFLIIYAGLTVYND
ncbi:uncharacterized protein LOC111718389 [Eurytemora carolleeae]|uniref:uncharacterized protein LOC111718389 n=1 Tax=Eurytemora carolleeae TaxID=1294199 RepID=UPI000C78E9EF|nr:uncharacterized protein LOC111718389 [Eurytemora carolleeae]|eukprot:XP_023349732.1 uncharacterized protein LOC111718389 [Eurytemora affinis]